MDWHPNKRSPDILPNQRVGSGHPQACVRHATGPGRFVYVKLLYTSWRFVSQKSANSCLIAGRLSLNPNPNMHMLPRVSHSRLYKNRHAYSGCVNIRQGRRNFIDSWMHWVDGVYVCCMCSGFTHKDICTGFANKTCVLALHIRRALLALHVWHVFWLYT